MILSFIFGTDNDDDIAVRRFFLQIIGFEYKERNFHRIWCQGFIKFDMMEHKYIV